VKQVFQIKRPRTIKGESSPEFAYGITSLSRERAEAERLLALSRGHRAVENRLFHGRDVTFGEDHSQVRTGQAPRGTWRSARQRWLSEEGTTDAYG